MTEERAGGGGTVETTGPAGTSPVPEESRRGPVFPTTGEMLSAPMPEDAGGQGAPPGPGAPGEEPRGPIPYERFAQVVAARREAQERFDRLRAMAEERERAWQQRYDQLRERVDSGPDPVEALRRALAPKEPEPADPLERDVMGLRKTLDEVRRQNEDLMTWRTRREEDERQQRYQSDVDGRLSTAIAAAGVQGQAREFLYSAVLTQLVPWAEAGNAVDDRTIAHFVSRYAPLLQRAPPAVAGAPAADASQEAPRAIPFVRGGGSSVAPTRRAPVDVRDADRMLDEVLKKGRW